MKKNLSVCALALAASLAAHGGERPRNVILITLDTTRADRFGCYGSKAGLTPNIDALAAGGVVFEHAIVPVPQTTPSHFSIFTGLYPFRHGVSSNGATPSGNPPTLAEQLRSAGYRTAAFTGAKLLLTAGLVNGFDTVDKNYPGVSRTATAVTDSALAYLKETPPDGKPLFLWVHYFDPHYPYLPPARFRDEPDPERTKALRIYLAWLSLENNERYYADHLPPGERDMLLRFFKDHTVTLDRFTQPPERKLDRRPAVAWYDGEIKYVDSELGRLFDFLRSSGTMKDSVVVIVADHGETLLLEDGTAHFSHGHYLQDREVRVPLIIFDGRGEYGPRRVPGQVRTLDILPTALAIAGLRAPKKLDGASLEPSLRGKKQALPPETFSYVVTKAIGSVRTNRWKLIHETPDEKTALYDLANDPDEVLNAAGDHPDEAAALLNDLKAWTVMRDAAAQEGGVDPQMIDVLKSLGYLK